MDMSFLGLGSTAGLNSDLISKLKTAETTSSTSLLDKRLETNTNEKSILSGLNDKFSGLSTLLSSFLDNDIINTAKMATLQEGTSVIYNSSNAKDLQVDNYKVVVSQLAQRDVFQSEKVTNPDELLSDTGVININGNEITTSGRTLRDVASLINDLDIANASVEQVSSTEYRLVIKGQESGIDNALTITQSGIDLGLETPSNKTLSAQNAKLEINGIDYDTSGNKVTMSDGLEITAMSEGTTTFKIEEDDELVADFIDEIVTQYNDIVDYITTNITNSEDTFSQKSSINTIMRNIKEQFFKQGSDLFNMGFGFDKDGHLSVDRDKIIETMKNDKENFYNVFVGSKNDGLIPTLNDLYSNSLSSLIDNVDKNNTSLTTERANQLEKIDKKYETLALQFATYNSVISSFENSFSSLKQLIDYQTSGNN